MRSETGHGLKIHSDIKMIAKNQNEIQIGHTFRFKCFRNGLEIWREKFNNLVVDVGLNYALDAAYNGSSMTLFCGLKGVGAAVASDVLSSHSNWNEITNFAESGRPQLTFGTVASKSVTAGGVTFSITATTAIAGALVAGNITKGGVTGTLVGAGDFAATRNVLDGDTIVVTVSATASAS